MEDIQSLLEKINREGVEKADAEAKRILDGAKADAEAIIRDAHAEADKAKADAEKAAAEYTARAAESIRQSARDVVLEVKESINALFDRLLLKNVSSALADEKTATELVASAIRELAGSGDISCGAKLAEALKAQAARLGDFTVTIDESKDEGFSVSVDAGRIEHAFTTDVIAAEIAKRLRPDLAALLD